MEFTEEVLSIVNECHMFQQRYGPEDFDASLYLDSMTIILIISRLEEKYGLDIDYRRLDLSHFDTIRTIQQYVSLLLQREEASS